MKKLGIVMYAWTLGLRSLRQKDCYEFETSIGYIEFIKKKNKQNSYISWKWYLEAGIIENKMLGNWMEPSPSLYSQSRLLFLQTKKS